MGWCQLYNLKDMIVQTHQTYSPMPMCSDVNNCLFGDGTLHCDIFLGGLFALYCFCFSVAFVFWFSALL